MAELLEQLLTALERAERLQASSARQYSAAVVREVQPAYETLAAWLRKADMACPELRPTNYFRNLFHVSSALLALLVIRFAPSQGYVIVAAAAFFCTAWSLETARRFSPKLNDRLMRFFGKVAHAHERHKVNSSTWYATALMLLALFCSRPVAALAVAVLGVGDPAAALVGRRFGKTVLRAGRSLEGSLAFLLAASAISLAVSVWMRSGPMTEHFVIATVAGCAGAIAEFLSKRLDDNFTIPLAVAVSLSVLLGLL